MVEKHKRFLVRVLAIRPDKLENSFEYDREKHSGKQNKKKIEITFVHWPEKREGATSCRSSIFFFKFPTLRVNYPIHFPPPILIFSFHFSFFAFSLFYQRDYYLYIIRRLISFYFFSFFSFYFIFFIIINK